MGRGAPSCLTIADLKSSRMAESIITANRMRKGANMTRLPLRTIDDAPAASKELLISAEKRNGFLPNLLRILANAPVALETYLTVSGLNARASLSVAEREVVQITAAATHGCGFCVAGHTAATYMQARLDKETPKAPRALGGVRNERLDAAACFTKAVIATRGRVDDTQNLRLSRLQASPTRG